MLEDTGTATDYDAAVAVLNAYFVPESMPHWQDSPSTKSHKNKVRLYNNLSHDSDKLLKTDFSVDRDNQLRDAVLSKCSSDYIKRKLLEEGTELTFTRTLEIAMQCERVELKCPPCISVSQKMEKKQYIML